MNFVYTSIYHRGIPFHQVTAPVQPHEASNWADLTWGNGPGSPRQGNLALALSICREQDELGIEIQLIIGGGVQYPDGMTESEAAYKLGTDKATDQYLRLLKGAGLNNGATNTAKELDLALQQAADAKAGLFIYVVAPFHAPRATTTLLQKRPPGLRVRIAPSDVDLPGGGVHHCVTAEPPHRGDDWQFSEGYPPNLRRHALEARIQTAFFQSKGNFAISLDAFLHDRGY